MRKLIVFLIMYSSMVLTAYDYEKVKNLPSSQSFEVQGEVYDVLDNIQYIKIERKRKKIKNNFLIPFKSPKDTQQFQQQPDSSLITILGRFKLYSQNQITTLSTNNKKQLKNDKVFVRNNRTKEVGFLHNEMQIVPKKWIDPYSLANEFGFSVVLYSSEFNYMVLKKENIFELLQGYENIKKDPRIKEVLIRVVNNVRKTL